MSRKKTRRVSPSFATKTTHFDMKAEFDHAQRLHQSGRIAEAEKIYREILVRYPKHPDTLHFLGIIAIQVGRNDIAVNMIQQALKVTPHNPMYLSNLGSALKSLGRLDEAAAYCRKAIQIKPDFADAHYNLATVLQSLGDKTAAAENYKTALRFKPNLAQANINLGTIFQSQGDTTEAIEKYRAALTLQPNNVKVYINLGIIFHKQGDLPQAMTNFETALKIQPDYAEAHYNMGNVLHSQGNLESAINAFKQAIQFRPDYADAYYNMGTCHQERDDLNAAVSCFQKAILLNPRHITAKNNLGNTLVDLGRPDDALVYFDEVIADRPDFADVYNNKGNAMNKLGRPEEALASYQKACELNTNDSSALVNLGILQKNNHQIDAAIKNFEKALAITPDMAEALSHLTHQLQHVCDLERYPSFSEQLDSLTQKMLANGDRPAETPFVNISRHADPSLNYLVARAWSTQTLRQTANLMPSFSYHRRSEDSCLTIGYLSNNFRDHPMAHVMSGLFQQHDRRGFNIFCYSSGDDDGSEYRRKIERDCDRFVDLRKLSTLNAAECIHRDQVNILVDLMGHTQNSRMDICALRPAPVQARYLGMAGTTGADFFDYIIADRIVIPKKDFPFYSENPVWLPDSYQVNDNAQKISDKTWLRAKCGLPDNGFVFCSFNSSYKIDSTIFDAWMRILKATPQSVLWLLSKNKTMENNLKKIAKAKGVASGRLIFAQKMPKAHHLSRLSLADLVLDTRIASGAASTSDALWAGVPVLTVTGSHFASRMSTSILTSIDLPELITPTLARYEETAVTLARNRKRLEDIRKRLVKNRSDSPLFNTPRFTRNLETAYRMMWQIYTNGEAARPIEVPVINP